MYWQVYLHKTVVCAEQLLISILEKGERAEKAGNFSFSIGTWQYFWIVYILNPIFKRQKHFLQRLLNWMIATLQHLSSNGANIRILFYLNYAEG